MCGLDSIICSLTLFLWMEMCPPAHNVIPTKKKNIIINSKDTSKDGKAKISKQPACSNSRY